MNRWSYVVGNRLCAIHDCRAFYQTLNTETKIHCISFPCFFDNSRYAHRHMCSFVILVKMFLHYHACGMQPNMACIGIFVHSLTTKMPFIYLSLRWRNNEHDSVSNHQPRHCLLSRLFGRRSKKTSKLCVTGLCAWNSPGTGKLPAQMASYVENVSIWWRHHEWQRSGQWQSGHTEGSNMSLATHNSVWMQ